MPVETPHSFKTRLLAGIRKNACAIILGALLALFYISFLAHSINLMSADTGRHVQNGKVVFETGHIADTNFYSYTEPSFPTVNHHWGSGALFFLAWLAGGFTGLHVFFIAISIAAFLAFFLLARKIGGTGVAALGAVPAILLLGGRTEIRPEVFSLLFSGLFILTLVYVRGNSKHRAWLAALPFLQALWTNTHIFFFLGPLIVIAFLIESLLTKNRPQGLRRALALTLLAVASLMLANPSGIGGVTAPFTIFANYGYRIAENLPLWFAEGLLRDPSFLIFKGVFILLAASFIARLLSKKGAPVAFTLLAFGAGAMAWLQIRNMALFGLFSIPILAENYRGLFSEAWRARHEQKLLIGACLIVGVLFIPASFGHLQRAFPYWHEYGLGLEQGNSRSADFFKTNNLSGPIFNNYDIGGYLIFHLFPKERVFVDNRPEAYSASFFRNTYIPMQENDEIWRAARAQYGFNTIFFSWRDMTPWAQRFLAARISDPDWAPVFADEQAIIFLQRTDRNKSVIDRYEILRNAFRVITP